MHTCRVQSSVSLFISRVSMLLLRISWRKVISLDVQWLISFLFPLVDLTSYRTVTQLDLCLSLSLRLVHWLKSVIHNRTTAFPSSLSSSFYASCHSILRPVRQWTRQRERERAVNFPQMTIVRHPTSGFPITSKHPWDITRFHRCSFSFPSVDIVESMKSSSELCRVIVISSFDLSVITSADWRWPFYEGSSVVHLEWMNVESELRRKVLRISFQIDAIVPRTTRITTHGFSTLRTREWLLWTHERLVKPDPISTREVGNQQKW